MDTTLTHKLRFNAFLKARYLPFALGSLICVQAAASSVEILVDAALDEASLLTANEVALQLVSSAGIEDTIGLVVYDEVFQRSVAPSVANNSHYEAIAKALSDITPSDNSNIAVGIEKGISELEPDGGVLLVLGNNGVVLNDTASVNKYLDWLQLVLLPDAANKSINVILASPKGAPSDTLNTIVEEYPGNKVVSYSNSVDALQQLSELLPFRLPAEIQISELTPAYTILSDAPDQVEIKRVESSRIEAVLVPIEKAADSKEIVATQDTAKTIEPSTVEPSTVEPSTVETSGAITVPATTATQPPGNESTTNTLLIMTVVALIALLFAVAAVTWFLLKNRRKSSDGEIDENTKATGQAEQTRYRAPKQGLAVMLAKRATSTGAEPVPTRSPVESSEQPTKPNLIDESVLNERELNTDEIQFDADVTAPRDSSSHDDGTLTINSDDTQERPSASTDDVTVSSEGKELDELEELRILTQNKQHSQL